MEIFELLFVAGESAEVCTCCFHLLTGLLDLSTAATGVTAVKETKKRRRLKAEGIQPEGKNTRAIVFWVLLPFALIATALAVFTLWRVSQP